MDFHINKTEICISFHNSDGLNYGSRSIVKMHGSMIHFDDVNQQFRDEFPQKFKNSENQQILVVCADESEQEFLKKGSSFEKTNIKLDLTVVDNELVIGGTLYLLKDDFDRLMQVIQGLPRPNTYLYAVIVSIGGNVTSPSKAYIEGYCEGVRVLSYLHGEKIL